MLVGVAQTPYKHPTNTHLNEGRARFFVLVTSYVEFQWEVETCVKLYIVA